MVHGLDVAHAQDTTNAPFPALTIAPIPVPTPTPQLAPSPIPTSGEKKSNVVLAPKILSAPDRQIAAYSGNTVVMTVKTDSPIQDVAWIKDNFVLCRTETCEINTTGWSNGRHQVVFLARNAGGERVIDFIIRIEPPPFGQATTKQEIPASPSPFAGEEINLSSMRVQATMGFGFLTREDETISLSRIPRLVKWNENIRSPESTVTRFGIPNSDEHFGLPSSMLQLGTIINENNEISRYIEVKDGIARSRSLTDSVPDWAVIVGNWLEVYSDGDGDFITHVINGQGGQQRVIVTVLRGTVQVTNWRTDGEISMKIEPEVSLLGVGQEIEYQLGQPTSPIHFPDIPKTSKVVKLSTPQYTSPRILTQVKKRFDGDTEDDDVIRHWRLTAYEIGKPGKLIEIEPNLLSINHVKTIGDETDDCAAEAINDHDYWIAQECLMANEGDLPKDYLASLRLARGYRGVWNWKLAKQHYELALKYNPGSGSASFELGELYLLERNWQKAYDYFKKAKTRDFSDRQLTLFYNAVSNFHMRQFYFAKNTFHAALVAGGSKSVIDSIKIYLGIIEDRTLLDFRLSVGMFKDSNIFRISSDRKNVGDIEVLNSYGYQYEVNLGIRAFKSPMGSVTFYGGYEQKSYLDERLSVINSSQAKFGGDFHADIISWDNESYGYVRAKVELQNHLIGEGRSADVYMYEVQLGTKTPWIVPYFLLRNEYWMDPLPLRDDILDPDTREVVIATDRSQQVYSGGSGFWLWKSDISYCSLTYMTRRAAHDRDESDLDDYKSHGLVLDQWKKGGDSLGFGIALASKTIDWPNSEDERQDTALTATLKSRIYLNYSLFFDTWFEYESQKSTRSLNSFKRSVIGGNISIML